MRSFGLFDLRCRKHSRTWLPRITASATRIYIHDYIENQASP